MTTSTSNEFSDVHTPQVPCAANEKRNPSLDEKQTGIDRPLVNTLAYVSVQ